MSEVQVAIVGGGAAGLAAAISAARAGARVTIYEKQQRVGQKILKTGNGRCNLTNMGVQPGDFNDPAYVRTIVSEHSPEVVLDFFHGLGLLTVEEDEGRVYPLSNAASSVLDVLRGACDCLGVQMQCSRNVVNIHSEDGRYALLCDDGNAFSADRVIVSTGGATTLLASLGHKITPFRPALRALETDTRPLKGLSGVRVRARVSASREEDSQSYFSEQGEVLFRDYGLSGIAIFDLSRVANPGDTIHLDFLPQLAADEYESFLKGKYAWMRACADASEEGQVSYGELLRGSFHPRLINAILRKADLASRQTAGTRALARIAEAAKDFKVEITGFGSPKQAQITQGGAVVDGFDKRTLESKLAPGVFAAGETLDIDGRCGGFNLHWAWASGLAAGSAAARRG